MAKEDPGVPPEVGIVVRAEEEGFYTRLYPNPRPDWRAGLGGVAVFGGVGSLLAVGLAEQTEVRVWILGSCLLFGALILGVAFSAGFFPVEVRGDDTSLSWSGERFPWAAIGSCSHDGGSIVLRAPDGTVLAQLDHLEPDAARWVALAIEASLP